MYIHTILTQRIHKPNTYNISVCEKFIARSSIVGARSLPATDKNFEGPRENSYLITIVQDTISVNEKLNKLFKN